MQTCVILLCGDVVIFQAISVDICHNNSRKFWHSVNIAANNNDTIALYRTHAGVQSITSYVLVRVYSHLFCVYQNSTIYLYLENYDAYHVVRYAFLLYYSNHILRSTTCSNVTDVSFLL